MPDVSGILDMGRRALGTHQRAISVTSHNIANVNTPGYSRQEAIYQTSSPRDGSFGTGVELQQVRRVVDRFLEGRIISEKSTFGRLDTEKGMLDRMEAIFQDATGEGLHGTIDDFFAAVHDLNNHPSGASERTVLLERADRLTQRFRVTEGQFQQLRADADTEIRDRVNEVNSLATRIADLNLKIRRVENEGEGAHDLRDERVRLVNELSEKIEIHVMDGPGKDFKVIVGQDGATAPLVMEDRAYLLSAVANSDNEGFVGIFGSAPSPVDITDRVSGGRIGGLIALRDRLLPEAIDQLDQLAASIVNEFNNQHKKGFGLDASTDLDFFAPLTGTVTPLGTNRGGATVTAVIAPPPVPDPNADPADPVVPPVPPAELTLDPYELSFSDSRFTLRNMTTGAATSTTDVAITFEGIDFTVTGTMAEGDRFRISMHKGVSGDMKVALTHPDQIAGASSAATLPGGNANLLALAKLQDKSVFALKGATLQGFYGSFIAEVGVLSQQAKVNLSVQETAQERLNTLREEVQGVSLDEEMSRLIQFQRAYQASARMVTTADTLLETIIGLKQ
jgi:flagellar hook-associated protein 1 FlgK